MPSSPSLLRTLKSIIFIFAGSAIYAFGLHYFIIPNRLMEGGITGIALLLNYSLQLSPALTTLLINIPLFYFGWKKFGRQAIFLTIVGTLSLSLHLFLMEKAISAGWLSPFKTEHDYFLAVLYAGLTIGLGLGIVFRHGGTTGGSDILARLGHRWLGWSVGKVILLIDVLVIGTSILYIAKEKVLYTLVVVFIAARTIDFIQEGAYASKACMIMTAQPEAIGRRILSKLEHSYTLFTASGGFSNEQKKVLYCVVYRHEIKKLKAWARQIDPQAFIIVHDVQDVWGEGFRPD